MITFPRLLARTLRTVLRRSVVEQEPRGEWPLLVCRAGPHGLFLEAGRGDVGVRHHQEGPQPPGVLAFRSTVLAELEGRGSDLVTVEPVAAGKARARWQDVGVPRLLDVETIDQDDIAPLPAQPARCAGLPESFHQALVDATDTAARESGRLCLTRLQLCGKRGQVAATDGRQLLIRGGFPLPWEEDLLVPRLPALALRELRREKPLNVCCGREQLALRLGPWTFFLAIDRGSRFPDVRAVVPGPSGLTCRLQLDPDDADFLARALPGLPGAEDEHAPVTLDLGERALLRACSREGPTTELELARSQVQGKPTRICLNRLFVRRALALGFHELHLGKPGKPVVWRRGEDVYVVVPLDDGAALPPTPDAVQVASAAAAPPLRSHHPSRPQPERRKATMPHSPDNGNAANPVPDDAGIDSLIAEAEDLRHSLQEAAGRAGRLVTALRQQRRQSRAVLAAVDALRHLKLGR